MAENITTIKLLTTDYSNLRSKTIFDFTEDKKLIQEITCDIGKDLYLSEIARNPVSNMWDLLDLAEITNNKALEEAVIRQYKEEYVFANNE